MSPPKLKYILLGYFWYYSLLSNGYKGLFSQRIKQPRHEADHSPPSSAEVTECMELYIHSPIRLYGLDFRYYDPFSEPLCLVIVLSGMKW